MATIEQSVEVYRAAPHTTSGRSSKSFQISWRGVREVRGSTTPTCWHARSADETKTWQAEITEQRPDQESRTSRDGAYNAGW
jgi:hypothetical protein